MTAPRSENVSAATVHEAAGRIGALPARIRQVFEPSAVYGPAYPVLCPVGDNLWLHRAVTEAEAGEVLVVQTTAPGEHGYWGEILSEAAAARHLGGLVIDGGVRDVRALAHVAFPVFSSAVCLAGTDKNPDAGGRLGDPIRLGGVRIERGDRIVGDEDGVVAIPRHRWYEVLELSRRRDSNESDIIDRIRSGETTPDIFSLPSLAESDAVR